jgi:hypothetical protein
LKSISLCTLHEEHLTNAFTWLPTYANANTYPY